MTYEGDTVKWKQLKNFIKEREAIVSARYYNGQWHITIVWDNGNQGIVEGINRSFAGAVERAWNMMKIFDSGEYRVELNRIGT